MSVIDDLLKYLDRLIMLEDAGHVRKREIDECIEAIREEIGLKNVHCSPSITVRSPSVSASRIAGQIRSSYE